MTLDVPFWFKQRQAKAAEVSSGTYKVSGPNLPEAVIGVRMLDDLHWQGFVKSQDSGPDVAASDPEIPTARDALAAAFELYRQQMVN